MGCDSRYERAWAETAASVGIASWRSQRERSQQVSGSRCSSVKSRNGSRAKGWLAHLEQGASQLLAKEVRIGHEFPLLGVRRARLKGLAAAAGSDCWMRIWPRNSSPRASRPGRARSCSVSRSASASRSGRNKTCSSAIRDSKWSGSSCKAFCQSSIARSSFWERTNGLTDQQVVLGLHRVWMSAARISPPRLDRAPDDRELDPASEARCGRHGLVLSCSRAFLLRRRPVLMVISGLALLQGARPAGRSCSTTPCRRPRPPRSRHRSAPGRANAFSILRAAWASSSRLYRKGGFDFLNAADA